METKCMLFATFIHHLVISIHSLMCIEIGGLGGGVRINFLWVKGSLSSTLPVTEKAKQGSAKHHTNEENSGSGLVHSLSAAHEIPLEDRQNCKDTARCIISWIPLLHTLLDTYVCSQSRFERAVVVHPSIPTRDGLCIL